MRGVLRLMHEAQSARTRNQYIHLWYTRMNNNMCSYLAARIFELLRNEDESSFTHPHPKALRSQVVQSSHHFVTSNI